MKLEELIIAVKEQKLSKDKLEFYRDQMSELFAKMQMEMAELEKEEALFMNGKDKEQSVADRKVSWKATSSGQRLIVLKRYATATKAMMSSLKDRLYNFY